MTMSHKTLMLGGAALLLVLVLSPRAQAWGAAHVGYTHVGPNGVYHAGRTAAYGGGGARYGGSAGGVRYGGAYGGAAYGGARYGGASYGGYHYGGYRGGASAGYVRRW
jgi:hypothetical protein